jgi:arabinose-5-phosphate isomerase
MKTSLEIGRSVLQIERAALARAEERLGTSFEEASALLLAAVRARARILVTGMGKSYHIGQKIAATLASTGVPATVLHPAEAMHGDIGMLQAGDLVLALSYSGESDELVTLLPLLRSYSVKIIAITGNPESTLGREADVVLDASVEREACPFNLVPTASTTSALALGDALAIALLEARGLTREDFARCHPGGAIGRSLLLKVDDIMRSGKRMASVADGATLKDALFAMTEAQAGACAVVDGGGRLEGLVSDGDVRRAITGGGEGFLARPVADIMTRHPTTVPSGRLAADALAAFRAHPFDDLPVVDAEGRVLGLIDVQDLPKFKIL